MVCFDAVPACDGLMRLRRAGGRSLWSRNLWERSYSLPIYWYLWKGNWLRYNFAAGSFHTLKLCSRHFTCKVEFTCPRRVGHFEPKFLIEGVIAKGSFCISKKLYWMPFHMVSKYWRSVGSFGHNTGVWPTDRRTVGRTALLWLLQRLQCNALRHAVKIASANRATCQKLVTVRDGKNCWEGTLSCRHNMQCT